MLMPNFCKIPDRPFHTFITTKDGLDSSKGYLSAFKGQWGSIPIFLETTTPEIRFDK